MPTGVLDIPRIRETLNTVRVGRRIEYFDSTTSTNDRAWERAGEADADGLVVLAEHQSAGRGRLGRRWHAPRGAGVLCSVLLVDDGNGLEPGELSLIAGVAVQEALLGFADTRPAIKWPNDVVIEGRKVAGVLVESRVGEGRRRFFVVGIGINCLQQQGHFPPELAGRATSLDLESTRAVDRSAVVLALLPALDKWLSRPQQWTEAFLCREWLNRADAHDGRIRLRHGGRVYTGSMVDIDPCAALVVRLDEGGVRMFHPFDTTVLETEA